MNSIQPIPVRPSATWTRAIARGKRASRPSGDVSSTGDQASGSTDDGEIADVEHGGGGDGLGAELGPGVERGDQLETAAWRLHVADGPALRRQRGHGVEAGAVVEAEGGPAPAPLPPVALAPRVVALARSLELDALVAHQDLAVHAARDLVAVDARPPERDAVGLPLEVEAERGPLALGAVVGVGRIVEAHAERLEPEAEVVERGLDVVIGPQAVGPDLERLVVLGERAPRCR